MDMDIDIFEQFPDKETFNKYWAENYVPVTYEDVQGEYEEFVQSKSGHIYLADYEEKGCVSRDDFTENLTQSAQFAFEDGLTNAFYAKNPELYEIAFELYEVAQMTGEGDPAVAQIFHDTFRSLYKEFMNRLFDEVLA